jgi:RNA polymerase sigma-70 factor (ECF subfamily)
MSNLPSDADDWALALGGDGEAFGRVYDRHYDRLYRHSCRLARPDDIDDVVAVTFHEAWRRRDSVHFVDGSVLPWLLTTATNAARNIARARRRHRALLLRLPPSDAATDAPDRLDVGDAELALRTLPLIDQQVITLCVLEGFSEREASTALGVAPGTVKSRLSRAKARLGSALQTRRFDLLDFEGSRP